MKVERQILELLSTIAAGNAARLIAVGQRNPLALAAIASAFGFRWRHGEPGEPWQDVSDPTPFAELILGDEPTMDAAKTAILNVARKLRCAPVFFEMMNFTRTPSSSPADGKPEIPMRDPVSRAPNEKGPGDRHNHRAHHSRKPTEEPRHGPDTSIH